MPKVIHVIDTSDRSVEKERKYLKKYFFKAWFSGEPEIINCYSFEDRQERELLSFRNKKEVIKFAKFLIKYANKNKAFWLSLEQGRMKEQ